MSGHEFRRYIVLPSDGFRSGILTAGGLQANTAMTLSRPGSNTQAVVRVLDQISADGPKLVEMNDDGEIALMREYAGEIRVIPLHSYDRPRPGRTRAEGPSRTSESGGETSGAGERQWQVRVIQAGSDRPVAGGTVIAFTSFRWREGAEGVSGDDGIAKLPLDAGASIERLYIRPPVGYWGAYRTDLKANEPLDIALVRVDPNSNDLVLSRFLGDLPEEAGQGVRVGIIDTGVARGHPNLQVAGGRNCVFDETVDDPDAVEDWDDVDLHGSHVAGIVAARPAEGSRIRGVAPQVDLRAYRVFPRDGGGASNFDVMKAIQYAVADGCHIVNLSLGGTFLDEALRAALGDARGAGVLVVAAAGNDSRKAVLFPAAYESVIAVSAIGVRGTFPDGSLDEAEIAGPVSVVDKQIFLARFTNIGPQIKLTAPGVGVVSTVPGGLLPLSGTSMAAPMVAGLAAAILSADPSFVSIDPQKRVKELIGELYNRSVTLGFARDHEGAGMPLPLGQRLWRNDAGGGDAR